MDTRYPFILFVSQAETEAVLGAHLAARGVTIERGVELVRFDARADHIDVVLRKRAGAEERMRVQYLVGCDGAHSTVRKQAGIAFEGDAYVQNFVLGDVELDARNGATPLASNTVHSFPGRYGVAMIFPLGAPASWRVIAMSTRAGTARENVGGGRRTSRSCTSSPSTSSSRHWTTRRPARSARAIRRGSRGSTCITARRRTTARGACSSRATRRTSTARSAARG